MLRDYWKSVTFVAAIAVSGCAPGISTEVPEEPPVQKVEAPKPKQEAPDTLKQRIEVVIDQVRSRDLRTDNAFWTVFHGILTFGDGLTLLDNRSETRVQAIDYILAGDYRLGEIRGMRFIPTQFGVDVSMGPTFVGQGHQDQFIAILAQWDIPIDRTVNIYGKEYTIRDFVNQTKANARVGQELSWTIIVLGKYLGTDIEWTNAMGEKLHYDDLIRSELNASVETAACGGTHRLSGMTLAYHLHLSRGGEETQVWKDVAKKIADYQKHARDHQNPDGSFSTNYFRGPGSDPDVHQRLGSTGHIFEWLAMSLSHDELQEPWMQNAANALSMMFLETQSVPIESGALYHAAHGLILYYERIYGWDKQKQQTPTHLSSSKLSPSSK